MTFSKVRILLVDDNILDRNIALKALSKLKYPLEILTFTNGQEVLDYIETEKNEIHLMITDLHMPIKDGYQILEHLQYSSLKTFPIVIMSSSNMFDDKVHMFKLGASAIHEKPFGTSQSIQLFGEIVNKFVLNEFPEVKQRFCA